MTYYAKYDWFVFYSAKDNGPQHGFCNTKRALAFRTKEERDGFVEDMEWVDLSCKKLTRKQAERYTEQGSDPRHKVIPYCSYCKEERRWVIEPSWKVIRELT